MFPYPNYGCFQRPMILQTTTILYISIAIAVQLIIIVDLPTIEKQKYAFRLLYHFNMFLFPISVCGSSCITCVSMVSLSNMFVVFICVYPTSLAQVEWPYHVRFVWYGAARRLHSTLLAVCGSGDTRTPIKLYHAVIHIEYHSPQKRFLICLLYTSPSPRD